MKTIAKTFIACGFLGLTIHAASAQNAVLSELYGQGVHAYYAGNVDGAHQYLTMAVDNGIDDPRAYYFLGMVDYATGREEEAESDWKKGAELEANGRANPSIGRSLARFQGSARLKLEMIREKAKLEALATAMSRSKERYGEINSTPENAVAPPAPTAAPSTAAAAFPANAPPAGAASNPFADDMAQGEAKVVEDDAFKNALNDPFAGEAGAAAGAPPAANPFGGGAGAAADPFGGGAGAGADPFGGGAGAGADPFGGGAGAGADPFGGGAGAGADPFGGGAGAGADPFGGGADAGADPFGGGADAGADPFGN